MWILTIFTTWSQRLIELVTLCGVQSRTSMGKCKEAEQRTIIDNFSFLSVFVVLLHFLSCLFSYDVILLHVSMLDCILTAIM